MRALVLSDIHANLVALEAVLDDAKDQYDTVWCLGDTVGYGPEPDECVTRVRNLGGIAIVGNHDWAALERMNVDDFNPEAKRAVIWTREHISPSNMAWLGALSSRPVESPPFTLTHGSPRDPIWEYILTPSVASASFHHFHTPYCLVGHTHVPAMYTLGARDGKLRLLTPVARQQIQLDATARAIFNPGSVGQPRDNDRRAAYAIIDAEKLTIESRRVEYLIEVTQARMRAAKLPERLITRLAFGW